jgi:peptidoglycan/LPS O-acetylase OafA/YrhL
VGGGEYRADIDGLRAVSVIAVILFHMHQTCPGGYVGVDVFFVISGYLITGLILKEERFSLGRFWERRIKRIMPAATVTVAITLAIACDARNCATETADAAIAQQLMLSNVYFWMHANYWDNSAANPLLHTWSLAVEEQFYILLPLVLIPLRRFRWVVLPGILLTSFGLCEWMSYEYPSANFYLLPTRAWELLIGSVLSMIPCRRARPALGYLGLAMILGAIIFFGRFTRFPSVWALLPCLGAAFVIYGRPRLLALRPLPQIGLISYSLYLWHWPLIVLLRGLPELLMLPLTFGLAYLSWRWIETPLRRAAWPARRVFASAAVSVIAVVASAAQVAALPSQVYQASVNLSIFVGMSPAPSPVFHLPEGAVWLDLGTRYGKPATQPIDFVVWGDSHADAVASVCSRLATEQGLTGVLATQAGSAPLIDCWCADPSIDGPNAQRRWANTVAKLIVEYQVKHVILVVRWDNKLDGALCDEQTFVNSPADSGRVVREKLKQMTEALGIAIWLVPQAPRLDPRLDGGFHPGTEINGITRAEYRGQQATILSLPEIAGVNAIAPGDWWPDERSITEHDGQCLYLDDDHVNEAGAELLMRPLLAPIIRRIAEDKSQSEPSE